MPSEDFNLNLIRLSLIDGLGVSRIRNLINYYKDPINVFNSDFDELIKFNGVTNEIANRIIEEKNEKVFLARAEKIIKFNEKNQIKILTLWDDNYPILLKNIFDPPVLLYYKGTLPNSLDDIIAFVGTRTPTPAGRHITEKFINNLAEYKIIICSGFARGIDTIAHKTALVNNMFTIAVLGCGLDIIYPPENKNLFKDIVDKGCLISEYPIGTKPNAPNFPRRNRIVSGLSFATVVIESDIDGGAMITAYLALDQNRNVYAVPGNIEFKQSKGPNKLIQKGEAKLITSIDDILEDYGNKFKKDKKEIRPTIQLSIFEEKIFSLLTKEPLHIDNIAEKTNLSTSDCLVALLNLEFYGLIKQLPGKMFIRF